MVKLNYCKIGSCSGSRAMILTDSWAPCSMFDASTTGIDSLILCGDLSGPLQDSILKIYCWIIRFLGGFILVKKFVILTQPPDVDLVQESNF